MGTSIDLEIGRVRLEENSGRFRQAFGRFDDYTLNGWSQSKEARRGEEAVIRAFHENETVLVEFDDGQEMYMPEEAVAVQLKRWKTVDERRHGALTELRGMVERMEDEEDVDVFDLLALDPDAPHRLLASNLSRAIICVIIQLLVPILVSATLLYRTVLPDEHTGGVQWNNLCDVRGAWTSPRLFVKIVNKGIAVLLLLYTYNFLTARIYLWGHKPTHRLLKQGLGLAVMRKPVWSAVGIITNAFALALCGFASIIVCFHAESPLDTVLNALALFFVVDIDDLLVHKYDYLRFKSALSHILESSKYDESLKVSVEVPRFGTILKVVTGLLVVVRAFLLISPAFILVCKLGVPFDGAGRK